MAVRVHIDETSCGALCQHPACWQSNTRQDKGFPRLRPRPPSPPDIELDLPTLKVCNMLEDYGEDPKDKFPSKFGGKPTHERNELLSGYHKPIRTESVKVTRAPQTSPKSGSNSVQPPVNAFKVVEVQEVFDPEDLQGTWDDTFVPKSYYIWVPNKRKKKRKQKLAKSADRSHWNDRAGIKDMTESMVPKEIENMRLTARKKRAQTRSPVFMRPYTMSPRTTMASSKMEFDHEGSTGRSGQLSVPIPTRLSGWHTPGPSSYMSISELLDLPREILVQVLENTRQSDLMSRERIREVIQRFMPAQYERGNTTMSLASQDLLQQKKLNLHEGNKNLRQPHLMETKPVFYLDDDVVDDELEDDEDLQRADSPYGSLKDLYLGITGNSRDFPSKYKKPLPAISGGRRSLSAAGQMVQQKIPSISLGLPELPKGIRQTKPFTYSKKAELDFTLAPVPTPPTSVRSTETPGSDHGTTIRVNIPSQLSNHSEHGSEKKRESLTRTPELMHAVSPTLSTRVPKAPATTPATNQAPSPTKSAPLLRDTSGLTIVNTTQDWPPREKSSSPLQILRAPVNTPGSVMQDAGLGTIPETAPDETGDQPHPVSRGRSVRFEIPEVPPPPSSPQLSEDGHKDPSRNTVTVNTNVPQETPSTSTNKPMSGATVRTDANTINTSTLPAENSFLKSQLPLTREVSLLSSPEPWPQVNEADYEAAPLPSPNTMGQESPQTLTTDQPESQTEEKSTDYETSGFGDKEHGPVPSPEKENSGESLKSKTSGHTEAVKKLLEDSQKAESPAPPPPSPEPKQDSNMSASKKNNKTMTPLIEETETPNPEAEEAEMTILQIAPKGLQPGRKKTYNRQIDTFQNIDIPASYHSQVETSPPHSKLPEPLTDTIPEEPETEHEAEEVKLETRDVALSAQSTLANRTISEQAQSEVSSSVIEPAISQASQAPALSEDFSERRENSELLGDWTGVILGSEGQDTTAMLSSEKQELDMTEEGGDHEGFKEDLRQEYERLNQDTSVNNESLENNEPS